MENNKTINRYFWIGRKVFLTGHTGFKGSWLAIWLHHMGARVTGYSLHSPTNPALFELAHIDKIMEDSFIGDVADFGRLKEAIEHAEPEIVIHMAAQPLVRRSYADPVETFRTNVMGTVNIMEVARSCKSVRVVLNVTTDKCYENQEWHWGYRETEPLGGHDPYSSSKACSELITSAYRNSFLGSLDIRVATARAGNVIGGGDWAEDRLIPDIFRSLFNGTQIQIRNPASVRPWQHVLEPLSGYLLLCQKLFTEGRQYAQSWNFGPQERDVRPVEWIVKRILHKWPDQHSGYKIIQQNEIHEAKMLKLDCSKAMNELYWFSKWSLESALDTTVEWFSGYLQGKDVQDLCIKQIEEYENFKFIDQFDDLEDVDVRSVE
ncbi:CDP-glucose 4,6-dehydratase [Paenibacillus pasadenensis]|uniref:CDP-glucose 4,6-dehydratase n=1 Tax=Paenibacillus pasadenensis TaxID=217090 RepID=UPI0020421016|nr:CDP-glucose 4,6-dehydratase [Paenibacillus pasadenensis]MCM3750208.1 CDP-glucose 4,6-dehydratase [Paenibacillus pasadenensis]